MKDIYKYLETFFLAGATVSGISYVGNQINPLAAGILSGIPISIPSMLLIDGKEAQKKFIFAATILVTFLALITGLCWLLLVHFNYSAKDSVAISFTTWCIGAFIYYLIIRKKNQ